MDKNKTLLFELGTEELPPKTQLFSAKRLLFLTIEELKTYKITCENSQQFASPSRIGFMIYGIHYLKQQSNCECKISTENLIKLLKTTINIAIKKITIHKPMRWHDLNISFIRPVHWAVLLLGDKVINCKILNCNTSNISYGHKFNAPSPIKLQNVHEYTIKLYNIGKLIVHWHHRKEYLLKQIETIMQKNKMIAMLDESLIEEVNGTIEWPNAVLCNFNKRFLNIPREIIVTLLKKYQKCFPMLDVNKNLTHYFIVISNVDAVDTNLIARGNQRVINARLADAEFFYHTDRKKKLEEFLPYLKNIVFKTHLGSMFENTYRVAQIAHDISKEIGADHKKVHYTAILAKADLATGMAQSFPDMHGIIGKYYSKADGEHKEIYNSIEQHYWPKHANDKLPEYESAQIISIADKINEIVSVFENKKHDKDPFAIRRNTIAIIKIIKEKSLKISIENLIDNAIKSYKEKIDISIKKYIMIFFIERLRVIYKNNGLKVEIFNHLINLKHENLFDFDTHTTSLIHFLKNSNSKILLKNNKRISNIIKKYKNIDNIELLEKLLILREERELYNIFCSTKKYVAQLKEKKSYSKILEKLSVLNKPIESFFENIMIMDKEVELKNNRMALLEQVNQLIQSSGITQYNK